MREAEVIQEKNKNFIKYLDIKILALIITTIVLVQTWTHNCWTHRCPNKMLLVKSHGDFCINRSSDKSSVNQFSDSAMHKENSLKDFPFYLFWAISIVDISKTIRFKYILHFCCLLNEWGFPSLALAQLMLYHYASLDSVRYTIIIIDYKKGYFL